MSYRQPPQPNGKRSDNQPVDQHAEALDADPAVLSGPVLDAPDPQAVRNGRWLTRILDDIIVIPGTKIGVGLDGIVGLIPGVGDATTTVVGGLIMVDAMRNRVPLVVLARMASNLGVDALLGTVPFVGDAADFAHRANRRNVRLLEQSIADRELTSKNARGYFIAAAALIFGTIALLVGLLIVGLVLIWRALFG